jgi:hypothetical protein
VCGEGAQQIRDGQLELGRGSRVGDHVGRPAGLLVLAELAELAGGQRFVAAGRCSLAADLVIGDHGDRRIIGSVHLGLEEEWRLDDGGGRRRPAGEDGVAKGAHPLGDERPEQALQPDSVVRVGEHAASDHGPVDHTTGEDVPAEAGLEGCPNAWCLVELVDDRVGRERRRSETVQQAEDG